MTFTDSKFLHSSRTVEDCCHFRSLVTCGVAVSSPTNLDMWFSLIRLAFCRHPEAASLLLYRISLSCSLDQSRVLVIVIVSRYLGSMLVHNDAES